METILKKLKEQGWYLTENGLKKILAAIGVDENSADVRKIIATALDLDFRDIASGALPATSKREETLPGRIVLQISKVRNISAPKSNEESKTSPRFLQLELTDGQNSILGLELEHVPTLSLNLPPGTKIYFHPERLQLMQGYLVLRPQDLQVLGGRVEALVEKWELARTMQKYARSGHRMSGATGPPPWIAFGKKIEVNKETLPSDRNFKSLQAALEKEKDKQENQEFNAMRTEAIAEATKAGAKKVFGGGNQQIIDHNLKKILEKGYTEEEAKNALRATKNNLERALYNLKRRQESRYSEDVSKSYTTTPVASTRPMRGGGVGGGRDFGGKRGAASAKEEAGAAKPAANVSLFDFLTDKLPANTEAATSTTAAAATSTQSSVQTYNTSSAASKYEKPARTNYNNKSNEPTDSTRPRFENNISSSFAANRSTGNTRSSGPRGGGHFEDRNERNGPHSGNQTQYQQGSRNNRNSNERSTAPVNSNNAGAANRRDAREDRGGQRGERGGPKEERGGPKEERGGQREDRGGSRETKSGPREDRGGSKETRGGPREDKGFQRDGRSGSYDNRRAGGSRDYQQHGQNRNTGERERYGGNSREAKGYEKGRYNQRENNSKSYDGGSRQQNSYNNSSNNNASTTNIPTNSNNSNTSNNNSNINKLVEATSKMKIDKGREQNSRNQQQQQQQHHQQTQQQQQSKTHQRQHQQQSQQFVQQPTTIQSFTTQPYNASTAASSMIQQQQAASFAQLPNGFTYDPSKIIGFQSKETNEFALSLLKSQGVASDPHQPLPPVPVPVPAQLQHAPYVAAPLNATAAPTAYGAPAYMLPSPVHATAAAPAPFGAHPGENWLWKTGDLCFAKYWDDGNFYEAEVTAVSNKTCVVYFLGYGNHEEVLKTDCLPVTDANNCPINNYTTQQQPPQIMAPQAQAPPHPPQAHRYRGERQMYVPPPKRDH